MPARIWSVLRAVILAALRALDGRWMRGRDLLPAPWNVPDDAVAPDYDYLFILVLIGDSNVGKSCLLLRFAVSPPRAPPFPVGPHHDHHLHQHGPASLRTATLGSPAADPYARPHSF